MKTSGWFKSDKYPFFKKKTIPYFESIEKDKYTMGGQDGVSENVSK